MSDPNPSPPPDHGGPAAEPARLAREAFSLGVILAASLTTAALERHGLLPGQGVVSSLVLLIPSSWHARRFRPRIRLLPPAGARQRVFGLLFTAALLALLVWAAREPMRSYANEPMSFPAALHLAALVPISEEFFFRGLLLDHLRRGFSTTAAVVLCSGLFALLHGSPAAGCVAIALSLIGCLLVVRSGALAYAVSLHAAWNGFSQSNSLLEPQTRWYFAGLAIAVVASIGVASLVGTRERSADD